MTTRIRLIGVALVVLAASLQAQTLPCTRQAPDTSATNARIVGRDAHLFLDTTRRSGNLGPAEAFGIVALDVAAFEEQKFPDRPPVFSLLSEPVVVSATKASLLKTGDAIEAIDDHPITTSAGSRQFMYPTPGTNMLTVRRGRERVVLRFDVVPPAPCTSWITRGSDVGAQGRRGGGNAADTSGAQGRARGLIRIRPLRDSAAGASRGPIYVIDGVRMEPLDASPVIRYGFALACQPKCAKMTRTDGVSFYRFESAPTIEAIQSGSPAASAGLQVGDVLLRIDGLSILEEDGAIRLSRPESRQSIQVTVRRDGKEMNVMLQAPK
jgi:membrane-associated protease RseP (regulator of RpoE activity)